MIKRSGAIVLSILYLVTAMGFALNLRFCGDQVTSVKIDAPVKNCAMLSKCKSKCCTNKHLDIKVKDAHQGQWQTFRLKTFSFAVPKLPFNNFSIAQIILARNYFDKTPPEPPPGDISAFLKYQSFRI
jgi:hypothetical protein